MGIPEILIIVLVLVVVFGARKIPELGRGLGQGIKEFKRETKDPAEPVTDVAARPLDPVTGAPITSAPITSTPVTETASHRS